MVARPQKLTEQQIQERLAAFQGWTIADGRLCKQFRFKTFMAGIAFVNLAAAVAEEMDHHPDIYIRFGVITVSLVTHSAQGVTALDFEQAYRLEALV